MIHYISKYRIYLEEKPALEMFKNVLNGRTPPALAQRLR